MYLVVCVNVNGYENVWYRVEVGGWVYDVAVRMIERRMVELFFEL